MILPEADSAPRRASGTLPSVVDLAAGLAASSDPVLAYKARTLVLGKDPGSPDVVAGRSAIADSAIARDLLAHRTADGRIAGHAYRKWQGPHWTLACLAAIDYPPGDTRLRPLFEQVHAWLLSPDHLRPPATATYPDQPDRVRRCASQEGNAVWYGIRLGFVDDRTRELVDRLVAWQWPDGGWNCDKRLEARTASVVETAIPLRGLWAYGTALAYPPALEAAGRAAEFLLSRRLLWRHGGDLIPIAWGGPADRIHFPIQFYDVLFALQVMAEIGRIADPRCADALRMLAARRLPDGGFPIDVRNAARADAIVSRGTWAAWGPGGTRTSNPLVTVLALGVLSAVEREA